MKCCLMHAMHDPNFSEGKETGLHVGCWLKDDPDEGAENSCLWIQTTQGNMEKLG